MSQSSLPLAPSQRNSRHIRIDDSVDQSSHARIQNYDAERNQYNPRGQGPSMPEPMQRPGNHRISSWDMLNGIKKFEHSYEEFDTRNASENHLVFADGDVPTNKVRVCLCLVASVALMYSVQLSKFYYYLLNVSIVTRWFLFIVPVMGIIWIPGILQLAGTYPNGTVCFLLSFSYPLSFNGRLRYGASSFCGGVSGSALCGEVSMSRTISTKRTLILFT